MITNYDAVVSVVELDFLSGWQPVSVAGRREIDESIRVSRRIDAYPSGCFFNARKAVLKLQDYAQASLMEGWLVTDYGLMVEHGWIVRDGVIVDPTLPPCVQAAYFSGLEFLGAEAIRQFDRLSCTLKRRKKNQPFFFAFGMAGMQSPSWRRSYESAWLALTTSCKSAQ